MVDREEEELLRSWEANALAWTSVVRGREIPSRLAGTDEAVVRAVLARRPRRVLDLGCGEGWLARELASEGVRVLGVDASAPLVEAARAAGGGEFLVRSYAELERAPLSVGEPGSFDAIVCNFSLLHREAGGPLASLRRLLAPGGALVVQTLHPWAARGALPYRDGWREETFAAMGDRFAASMPWYFRTLSSWVGLLGAAGYTLEEVSEPAHPETAEPLSLLLVGRLVP